MDPSGLVRQVIALEGFGTSIRLSARWMEESRWDAVFPGEGVVWNYYYWWQWRSAADDAVEAAKKPRPIFSGTEHGPKTSTGRCVYDTIIVIGYSNGGDSVFDVVNRLQEENVKVDLAITVDPVPSGLRVIPEILLNPISNRLRGGPGYRKLSNVSNWINYYQQSSDPNGWPVSGAQNVDLTSVYPKLPILQDLLGLTPHIQAVQHASSDSRVNAATSAVPRLRNSWRAH